MKMHVYMKYDEDEVGPYSELIYSPTYLIENENLEYLGEKDIKGFTDGGMSKRTYL